MTQIFDIVSKNTQIVKMPVPDYVSEELREKGILAPDYVTLNIRENTLGELKRFAEREKEMQNAADPAVMLEFLIELLHWRAEKGTHPQVIKAMAEAVTPSVSQALIQMLLLGGNPKP